VAARGATVRAALTARRALARRDEQGEYLTGKDTSTNTTKGLVVPAGGGKHLDMTTPGRFAALKLLGHETNESVMLFEDTIL